jgi:hypothetical protein
VATDTLGIADLDVTLGSASVFIGKIQAEKIRIDFGQM